jgi:hypothetical protein
MGIRDLSGHMDFTLQNNMTLMLSLVFDDNVNSTETCIQQCGLHIQQLAVAVVIVA